MDAYKKLWDEIIPDRLKKEKEWKEALITWLIPNPYSNSSITAKLEALKALETESMC